MVVEPTPDLFTSNNYSELQSRSRLPHFQPSADSDLFATLLFDRQSAYEKTRLSPFRVHNSTTVAQNHALQDYSTRLKLAQVHGRSAEEHKHSHSTLANRFWTRAMSPRREAVNEKQRQPAKATQAKSRTRTSVSKPSTRSTGITKSLSATARRNPRSSCSQQAAIPESKTIIELSSSDEETEVKKEDNEKAPKTLHQLFQDLNAATTARQNLQHELEAERERIKTIQEENENLASQLRSAKAENDNLARQLQDSSTEKNKLVAQLQESKGEKDKLVTQLQDLSKAKDEQAASTHHLLRDENTQLRNEINQLKASVSASAYAATIPHPPPPLPATLPPYPLSPISTCASSGSSSIITMSSSEDLKLDNIRKTYAKLKMRQNSLQDIVRRLDSCTRSMDLSRFGEFGAVTRQMREWLEEDDRQQKQQQQRQQQQQQ
jgi:uncharacterized phage infection (PIP) family protein YhgE